MFFLQQGGPDMGKFVTKDSDGYVSVGKYGKDASGSNKADVYTSKSGDKSHCHAWIDKDGKMGVKHRGACDECNSGK